VLSLTNGEPQKQLVKMKDVPFASLIQGKLLIMLPRAWFSVLPNLFPHYFLSKDGTNNNSIATTMKSGKQSHREDYENVNFAFCTLAMVESIHSMNHGTSYIM
jgi:hypothetical protein